MRVSSFVLFLTAAFVLSPLSSSLVSAEQLLPHVTFERGPINGVLIGEGPKQVAVYSKPASSTDKPAAILLTHHRRDHRGRLPSLRSRD